VGHVPAKSPPPATTRQHQAGVVTQLPGSLAGQKFNGLNCGIHLPSLGL
jgi:hypothetical protein